VENQRFNTSDVLSVYGSVLCCFIAVFLLLRGPFEEFGGSEAQREMIQLSRQILSDGLSTLDPNVQSSRGPASKDEGNSAEGRIGSDPWGRPYHYRIYQFGRGYRSVVIWSLGPNGLRDTTEADVLTAQNGRPFKILSRADDLGHIETGL
jgi:hypothetical protein